MKTRISKLYLGGGIIRYTIEHREHWWQRWHFMMDGRSPRLFNKWELNSLGYRIDMKTIEERTKKIARKNAKKYKIYCDYADKEGVCAFVSSVEECEKSAIDGAEEQKAIDKEEAHKAFVELLAVQYGEDCDESMHQYIDDVLKKYMEE